ncbi:MAG TPA: sugar ABC transporter permease [bacterium]|nr:sugar ABC transporter permease [bacterium]
MRRERRVFAFAMMAPTVLWTLLVLVYPVGVTLRNSLYNVGAGFDPHPPFVGLGNYAELVEDPIFWHSVRVTVLFTLGNLLGSFGLGLVTALLLHERFRGRAVARAVLLLPWAMPQVAAVVVWRWLLQVQYGALNYVLWRLHVVATPSIQWLIRPSLGLYAVLAATVWWQYPIATTFLQAGIQSVPVDLYEAAGIDGANGWQRFRHITWPGLRHVRNILLLMLLFWSLGQVIIIWTMTAGGPARATQTLAILVYQRAFSDFQFGSAAALATIVLAIALSIGVLYYRLTLRTAQES